MGRIRTIKPSFFKDEKLADLDITDRLLFIGLWTIADREGRLEDRPKFIKVEIFPYDKVDVEAGLEELIVQNLIVRYEVEGRKYIAIKNFLKHQRPNHREADSEYPAPACPGKHGQDREEGEGEREVEGEREWSRDDGVTTAEQVPYQDLGVIFSEECKSSGIPRINGLDTDRRKIIAARWREQPELEFWREFYRRIARSDFLSGRAPPRNGGQPFLASWDWIHKASNFRKICEGNYDNRSGKSEPAGIESLRNYAKEVLLERRDFHAGDRKTPGQLSKPESADHDA